MIDRRVPMMGDYGVPRRRSYDRDFSTGPYYITLNYDEETNPSFVSIAPVPKNKQKLLEGDYLKERSHWLRFIGAAGVLLGINALTHSAVAAWGTAVPAWGLMEIQPVWEFSRFAQQDELQKKLRYSDRAWKFNAVPIKMSLPLEALGADIEFVADELGYRASTPTDKLVDSIKDFPGLSVKYSRLSKKVNATLSPSEFMGTIVNNLRTSEPINRFLGNSALNLDAMQGACRSLPRDVASPELAEVKSGLQTQLLAGTLGVYANFLAQERERVASRVNQYDSQLPMPASCLPTTDNALRDVVVPMPWRQVLAIDRAVSD